MTRYRDHLFVYGTLKSGAQHPMGAVLHDHARLEAHATIQARLYIITEIDQLGENRYPGAVPSDHPDDRVHGEVWRVLRPTLLYPKLDAYECCSPEWPEPHEFLYRRITATTDNGDTLPVGAYLYSWDTARAEHLPAGRYNSLATAVR